MIQDQVFHCGHFLVIKDREVGLIHQSAKEYLLREACDPNPELECFRIQEKARNLEIDQRVSSIYKMAPLQMDLSI